MYVYSPSTSVLQLEIAQLHQTIQDLKEDKQRLVQREAQQRGVLEHKLDASLAQVEK